MIPQLDDETLGLLRFLLPDFNPVIQPAGAEGYGAILANSTFRRRTARTTSFVCGFIRTVSAKLAQDWSRIAVKPHTFGIDRLS
jgi:hypothetical protein